MSSYILSINSLEHYVEGRKLFGPLNISFLASSLIWIKGSNGSGKTSLLRILSGIARPYSGRVYYDTKPEYSSTNSCNSRDNSSYGIYIGHELGLKNELTVYQHLEFRSNLYNSIVTLSATIRYLSLENILHKKCYELSVGMRKRVAMASLLCCGSDLWLLDEIDSNLDEGGKELLYKLISCKVSSGGIVVMVSHSSVPSHTYVLDLDKL